MYRTTQILLINIFLTVLCLAGCHRQSSETVTIDLHSMGISKSVSFDEVRAKKALPAEVVKWFPGGIADRGEKFLETDVGDSRLPMRRLLVAGVSPKYCIVNYERGGIAHGYVLLLFARDKDSVQPVWTGASGNISTLSELKRVIDSGKAVQESSSNW